ncbi:MAG TPA: PH domain-containing protein [Lysobacter sp.]|nr:PH domain-containing protein [Lysobacter sp.]
MSWLFVLLQQLKHFIAPLVLIFVFGQQGDREELWPLVGVAALVLLSVWQYFTYRFGIADDRLVVRSGLLERSVRVIPFARIHNVALQQTLLHRLFGVAEVRLESAGGTRPEAEMRVLKMSDALALEALIRRRAHAAAPSDAESIVSADERRTLLALPLGEVIRLGLISNRGMLVVGAGFAGVSQFDSRLLGEGMEWLGRTMLDSADVAQFGPRDYVLGALAVVGAALALVRLLSVVLALLQYYGFTLTEEHDRLTVERGLLARLRTSAARRRIQAWTLREGVLHRLFGRRSLLVDTAVGDQQHNGQARSLRELAPIATPAQCDGLIAHLLPHAGWGTFDWHGVSQRQWWRLWLPSLAWVALATGALVWRFGAPGLLLLLWLPWAAYAARRHLRAAGYALNDAVLAVREGWWSRHWRWAELDKLQALRLTRSPLDRRCGTATLWLDTAGANPLAPPLRVRYLPESEARALHDRLAALMAARPMRW